MDTQHRQGVGHTWLCQYMVQLAGKSDSAGTIARSIWLHIIDTVDTTQGVLLVCYMYITVTHLLVCYFIIIMVRNLIT